MTDEQVRRTEAMVNAEILRNEATSARHHEVDDAVKGGAMALFGEKYGDEVRVLDIGSSRELCGGTHVARTGDIAFSRSRPRRRGGGRAPRRGDHRRGALAWVQALEDERHFVEGFFQRRRRPEGKAQAEREEKKTLEKELARLKSRLAASQGGDLAAQAVEVKGIKVLAAALDGADAKTLRETLDKLKDKLKSAAIVLGSSEGGKVSLIPGLPRTLRRS